MYVCDVGARTVKVFHVRACLMAGLITPKQFGTYILVVLFTFLMYLTVLLYLDAVIWDMNYGFGKSLGAMHPDIAMFCLLYTSPSPRD